MCNGLGPRSMVAAEPLISDTATGENPETTILDSPTRRTA